MEITQTLPQKCQIQNYTVTLNTIPHTSRNTRCHLNIPLSHFFSNTNKPKLHESCSTKSKPYSMLEIKNFLCCVVKEKFRNSFVLLKKYSVREINNFPKRYKWLFEMTSQNMFYHGCKKTYVQTFIFKWLFVMTTLNIFYHVYKKT